jgi:hypothetical protein
MNKMESHIHSTLSQINQFHDACGIGFIAESSGNPSRRVLELSFKALQNMQHRGAIGADEEMACPPKVVPSVKLVVVQTARKREYDT